jgi:hypothetical protein
MNNNDETEYIYENNDYNVPPNNAPRRFPRTLRPARPNMNAFIRNLNVPAVPNAPQTRLPLFAPNTNNYNVIEVSRRSSGDAALEDIKKQLALLNREGAKKLLIKVALDDILNHLRSVGGDDMNVATVQSLYDSVDSAIDTGSNISEGAMGQIKSVIRKFYNKNMTGVVYPRALNAYAEMELKKNLARTHISSLGSVFKAKKTLKKLRLNKALANQARRRAENAAAAAKAAVNLKAAQNAARKAAFEKRFGPGKTRRGRK